jgi:hypothetical protein
MVNSYSEEVCGSCGATYDPEDKFYCGECNEEFDTEDEAEECCKK